MHTKAGPAADWELAELNSALAGTIFANQLEYLAETASTNLLAMEAAAQGLPEGAVFLADRQTAGRGRGGHSWDSEPGTNLLLSFVLRPRIAPADALWLSLMSGLAVQQAIHHQTGLAPDLRWPNDLLLHNKKLCGILTELSSDGNRVRHAVVGIGINVNQREFPQDLSGLATSLAIETGRSWQRSRLLVALLTSLDSEYRMLLGELTPERTPTRPISLLQRLRESSSYIQGKPVHVSEEGGYDGTTAGLDERGFLLVRTPNGVRRVISGGVRELQ